MKKFDVIMLSIVCLLMGIFIGALLSNLPQPKTGARGCFATQPSTYSQFHKPTIYKYNDGGRFV